MSTSSVTRPYRGVPASDRAAARRDALMQAGLQVFDSDGWSALSARRVCEVAGLTRRYFYESFESLDALVAAIFVSITAEVSTAIRASITQSAEDPGLGFGERLNRAAVAAFAALVEPPVKGRFLVAAQRAGGAVSPHRVAALRELESLLGTTLSATRQGADALDPTDVSIAARMVIGAMLALVESWLEGDVPLSRDEVIARTATAAVAIVEALTAGAGG